MRLALLLVAVLPTFQEAVGRLPAEPPIGGPLWTVVVPAALLLGSTVATWLLYRRFSRED
jgi:hypothetical protein